MLCLSLFFIHVNACRFSFVCWPVKNKVLIEGLPSMAVRRKFSTGATPILCLYFASLWRCNANLLSQNALPFLHHKEDALCYGNKRKNAFVGSSSQEYYGHFTLKHHACFKNWADELWRHATANTTLHSLITQNSEPNLRAPWCKYFWHRGRFAKMWQFADHFQQNHV